MNDPKKINGDAKTPLHLLPPYALAQIALAHAEGAERYGAWNWRKTGVCATTYIGAIMRHLAAWQDGEDIDPDSGLSHIAKIGASVNILLDAMRCGTLEDDRSKLVQMRELSPDEFLIECRGGVNSTPPDHTDEAAFKTIKTSDPFDSAIKTPFGYVCKLAEEDVSTPEYRMLQKGEVIVEGDEVKGWNENKWYPCVLYGYDKPVIVGVTPDCYEGHYRRKVLKQTFAEVLAEASSKISVDQMGETLHVSEHYPNVDPELPGELPPLPPVPEGFDRWVYRGMGWKSPLAKYGFIYPAFAHWQVPSGVTEAVGIDDYHYIEAVK